MINTHAKTRQKLYYLKIALAMTDRVGPAWLASLFGGSVSGPRRNGNPAYKPVFRWQISGQAAYEFLAMVESFLKVKRPQALTAIEFFQKSPKIGRGKREPRSQDVLEMQHAYKLKMHYLKTVPVMEM